MSKRASAPFWRQLRTLLARNVKLKIRRLGSTMYSVIYPVYMVGILCIVAFSIGSGAHVPSRAWPPVGPLNFNQWVQLDGKGAGSVALPHQVLVSPNDTATLTFVEDALRLAYPGCKVRGVGSDQDQIQFNGPEVLGGVVFEQPPMAPAAQWEFALRVNQSLVPAGAAERGLASRYQCVGPGSRGRCAAEMWLKSPFVALELALVNHLAAVHGQNGSSVPELSVNQAPTTARFIPPDFGIIETLLPVYLGFSFFPIVQHLITSVVAEKESKRKIWLQILGTRPFLFWLSWAIVSAVLTLLTCTILVVLMIASGLMSCNGLLLYLFLAQLSFALIAFAYTLAAFVDKAKTGGGLGALAMLVASVALLGFKEAPHAVQWIGAVLLPPVASGLGLDYISQQTAVGIFVSFSNTMSPSAVDPGSSMTLGECMLALAVSTVLYFALAVYLDAVVPTNHGVAKPWNYPFLALCGGRQANALPSSSSSSLSSELSDAGAALVVRHLSKSFKKNRRAPVVHANNDISFDAHDGEIIGLLGHNAAGKSTLIASLVGLHQPDSGSATLFGLDIATDIDQIRQWCGFVPQGNEFLHQELSCVEHMALVAGLKGVPLQDCLAHLDDVGLSAKSQNQRALQLSGGQQRKLALAMALVGEPRLLVLDEHSAGIDPLARRHLWNLLRGDARRANCVTLICTHFLDEAEALCDRVVVLESGAVRSNGTALHLKTQFGIAYQLQFSVSVPDQCQHLESLVLKAVPSATRVPDVKPVKDLVEATDDGADEKQKRTKQKRRRKQVEPSGAASAAMMRFELPLNGKSEFGQMFAQLEDQPEVNNITLSLPSLEQVFMKLELSKAHGHAETTAVAAAAASEHRSVEQQTEETALVAEAERGLLVADGNASDFQKFLAYFAFSVRVRLRMGVYWVCSVCFPLVFTVAGLVLAANFSGGPLPGPGGPGASGANGTDLTTVFNWSNQTETWARDLNTVASGGRADWNASDFVVGFAAGSAQERNETDLLRQAFRPSAAAVAIANATAIETPGVFRPYAAFDFVVTGNLNATTGLLPVLLTANFSYVEALPLAVQQLGSLVLRRATGNPGASVSVTSRPYVPLGSYPFDTIAMVAGLLLCMAYTFSLGLLAIFPVKARATGIDHLMRISGVSRRVHWLTTLAVDSVSPLVQVVLTIVLIQALRIEPFMDLAAVAVALELVLYVPMSLLHVYLWSFLFNNPETCEKVMPSVFPFMAFVPFILLFVLGLFISPLAMDIVNTALIALVPLGTLGSLLAALTRQYYGRKLGFITAELTPQSRVSPAILASLFHIFTHVLLIAYVDVYRRRRAGRSLRAHKLVRRAVSEVASDSSGLPDVDRERIRVAGLLQSIEAERAHVASDLEERYSANAMLLADQAVVAYKDGKTVKVAVKGVSLAVDQGQRIALLGPNGAGKSSLMNFLVAMVPPAAGRGLVAGYDVETETSVACRHLGFTSQKSTLIDEATLREHLELFAIFRGSSRARAKAISLQLMRELGVEEHADQRGKALSGGTKRKLQLALATLSAPVAQIHDEPSTGVDVFAQRAIWRILRARAEHAGTVVSTHSMSEAQNLASIVVIMTNGRIRCIGTPAELLQRHKAVTLEIVSRPARTRAVDRFVRLLFPDARLLDAFGGRARYAVCAQQTHLHDAPLSQLIDEALAWSEEELQADPTPLLATAGDDEEEGEDLGGGGGGGGGDDDGNDDNLNPSRPQISFAALFDTLSRVRAHLGILDFAFGQPTLEEVFFRFAVRGQKEEQKEEMMKKKQ